LTCSAADGRSWKKVLSLRLGVLHGAAPLMKSSCDRGGRPAVGLNGMFCSIARNILSVCSRKLWSSWKIGSRLIVTCVCNNRQKTTNERSVHCCQMSTLNCLSHSRHAVFDQSFDSLSSSVSRSKLGHVG